MAPIFVFYWQKQANGIEWTYVKNRTERNTIGDSFVSRKDRIIASAIEIISESGLSALTTKNLALKENMSEALMYKYFGGIDEVLVEVVETYSKFDKGIRQTVQAKDATYV